MEKRWLAVPIQSSPILVRLTVDLNLAAEYGNAGGSWGNWPKGGDHLHSTIRTVMNPKSHCRALRCLHLNVEDSVRKYSNVFYMLRMISYYILRKSHEMYFIKCTGVWNEIPDSYSKLPWSGLIRKMNVTKVTLPV